MNCLGTAVDLLHPKRVAHEQPRRLARKSVTAAKTIRPDGFP